MAFATRRASFTSIASISSTSSSSTTSTELPPYEDSRPPSTDPSQFTLSTLDDKDTEMLLPGPPDVRFLRRRALRRAALSIRLSVLGAIVLGSVFLIWRVAAGLPESQDDLHFPTSFEDVKSQSVKLQAYSKANFSRVFWLFNIVYVFKQTFSVPGSAIMNILGGVLYGFWAFPWVSLLTAIGSTFSYLLSQLLLGELVVERFAGGNLRSLRHRVERNREKGNLFYFLLFLRLFPFSPNWFLNIASPFVGVPIVSFFLSIFFGLMPYNYICVQAAATLSHLNSFADILSVGVLLKLLSISVLALVPALCGKQVVGWIRSRMGNSSVGGLGGDSGEDTKEGQA